MEERGIGEEELTSLLKVTKATRCRGLVLANSVNWWSTAACTLCGW